VTFARLLRADAVAMVAALALLFVMALDWYSTNLGEEARRQERLAQPHGATGGEIAREVKRDGRVIGEGEEANAWQLDGAIDRLILLGLLATVVLAVGAAYLRAAGRRFEPPLTPSALAAVTATTTALLIAYRIIQEPGFDERTVVKSGAPLSLIVLAVIALACRSALSQEEAGTAWRELPSAETSETPAAT
jgi:hypothetical protein